MLQRLWRRLFQGYSSVTPATAWGEVLGKAAPYPVIAVMIGFLQKPATGSDSSIPNHETPW